MNSNNIEGSVPLALANCTQLQILDFGNNKLKDTFPWWLVALPKLQILVLRSNRLHGNLSVGNVIKHPFPKLRIMDLSHNRFSGNLPINFFDNFKDMADSDQRIGVNTTIVGDSYYEASISLVVKGEDLEVKRILYIYTSIDLSSNKFTGGVPKVLGELKSLRLLNLSDNKLTGHIPSLLGNMSLLESLDLSLNHLTGMIPGQLTSLTFLAFLNLSANNLSGSIPQGRQLDTMSNDSYLGNLALCGFPLTKKCRYDELPKPEVDDDNDDDWFDWKMMLMGYGSGLAGGLSMGYIVFTTGKPWRFVMFVEKAQQRLIRR
nr:PREDICTED: receptor like protein 30-like [Daucus carota subsp. sativus]